VIVEEARSKCLSCRDIALQSPGRDKALGSFYKLRRRPESERFFAWQSLSRATPREPKQAILLLSSMQLPARRDSQAENKPLEARSSFQTEPSSRG
jgi:hypothetical protein